MNKDTKALIKKALTADQSLRLVVSQTGHNKLYRDAAYLFTFSGTPGCSHAINQLRRDFKKYAGITI